LTKLHNDELPLVKAADLVNYDIVVLTSVYRYEQLVSYTVQLLATGKMLIADLRNIQ